MSSIQEDIEARASVAPRVTPANIEREIVMEQYFSAADGACFLWLTDEHSDPEQRQAVKSIAARITTSSYASIASDIEANSNGVVGPELRRLTICVLVLRNGFVVTGDSACVSMENFDAEIGRRVARQNAVNKIWPLLGFRLRDRLVKGAP